MVQKSRVLDELEGEADVPYEATKLARSAPSARKRVLLALLLGAFVCGVEAVLAWGFAWLLAVGVLLVTAVALRAEKLGAIIAAAFVAVLFVMLPLRFAFLGVDGVLGWLRIGVFAAIGLAMLPPVVTLIRDAELQYAYGRWAKRA